MKHVKRVSRNRRPQSADAGPTFYDCILVLVNGGVIAYRECKSAKGYGGCDC